MSVMVYGPSRRIVVEVVAPTAPVQVPAPAPAPAPVAGRP
jgi:hypothetical protein